jgi:hypothetical protein
MTKVTYGWRSLALVLALQSFVIGAAMIGARLTGHLAAGSVSESFHSWASTFLLLQGPATIVEAALLTRLVAAWPASSPTLTSRLGSSLILLTCWLATLTAPLFNQGDPMTSELRSNSLTLLAMPFLAVGGAASAFLVTAAARVRSKRWMTSMFLGLLPWNAAAAAIAVAGFDESSVGYHIASVLCWLDLRGLCLLLAGNRPTSRCRRTISLVPPIRRSLPLNASLVGPANSGQEGHTGTDPAGALASAVQLTCAHPEREESKQ